MQIQSESKYCALSSRFCGISPQDLMIKLVFLHKSLPAPKQSLQAAAFLPPRDTANHTPSGIEIEAMITRITDLGFSKNEAISALEASFYNVDRAAGYLIDGEMPEAPTPSESLKNQSFRRILLGDEAQAQLKPLNDTIEPLTGEQLAFVDRMVSLGYTTENVVQILLINDRNESVSERELLAVRCDD